MSVAMSQPPWGRKVASGSFGAGGINLENLIPAAGTLRRFILVTERLSLSGAGNVQVTARNSTPADIGGTTTTFYAATAGTVAFSIRAELDFLSLGAVFRAYTLGDSGTPVAQIGGLVAVSGTIVGVRISVDAGTFDVLGNYELWQVPVF